ncbi:alpha/beta hydrolase [Parvularcula sp. ZS-1/3]|uniref:Alpha/beta hydrolase n=1 Tax=Parvularcula mediterranea TaxID=2732508 RepID=A0A7Y3RL86_9PROT|nr:alpha/beta hydrolase [Parvularcula mediterranea]NNU16172.1 alpha/beta hydrolase [Parvularcula mediterranea]
MTMTGKTDSAIPIAYEVGGPEDGKPVLMLTGLGMQLTQWPEPFVRDLQQAGFRTIRIDHRDVGLSGRVEGKKPPNPYLQLILGLIGLKAGAPYTLEDMADDAVSVLDHLGIEKAHLIGLSMGGIVSQVLAARHTDRIDRIVFFMTSTNNRRLPMPEKKAMDILLNRGKAPEGREATIDDIVAKWQFFMTVDGGMSEADLRAFHAAAYDRGMDREGWQRQLAAILETGDLRKYTRQIPCHSLIVHGYVDKLVPVTAGKDLHANLEHSELELVNDMGHDLAPKFLPMLTSKVIEHLKNDRTH